MEAMNDRVINVPVPDDNIAKNVNTLPRNESNSGMVNVKLKRNMYLKNYHKAGMIYPPRIFDCLNYLVKNHPAYKNIQIEKEEEWKKKCPNFFEDAETDDTDVDDDEMGGGGCNAVALKLVN